MTVEHLEEIRLDNKTAVGEALGAVFDDVKSGGARAVCTVRPTKRFFHLASADEAKRQNAIGAIKGYAAGLSGLEAGSIDVAAVAAQGGAAVDGNGAARWFLAGVPRESLDAANEVLKEWRVLPLRLESATLSLLGAAQSSLSSGGDGPLLLWEVGDTYSDLFLITSDGMDATRRVKFGFDQIVDAIATEINLKFKASAAKLFFNDLYDFSESGPKIAARVAGLLQPEISALALQSGRQPASAFIAGIPGKQGWFTQKVAAALNLAAWKPELSAWAAKAGIRIAASVSTEGFSPGWLGVLGSVAAVRKDKMEYDFAWHPLWRREGPAPVDTSAQAPASKPAARPIAAVSTPAPAPAAKPEPAKPAAPAPVAKPVAPAPVAKQTPAPAPVKKEAPAPARKEPAPVAKAAPVAKPAAVAAAAAKPDSSGAVKKSKAPMYVGIAAAIAILGATAFYFVNQMQVEKAKFEHDKEMADKRAASDAAALRVAEQKAREESEARKKAEELAQQTTVAAEAARKRAAEETARHEEEKRQLLYARGTMVIETEPAGATVVVDNLAARQTPATIGDLRLGQYTAEISMPGYDPVSVDVEVKEKQDNNPGLIKLVRQTGNLELISDPAGVVYEVRPAAARPGATSADTRQGKTPATIKGLPTGDYIVTLVREGWPTHTQKVTVERNGSARISRNFSGGAVNITSTPQGASVFSNGVAVGVTPITVKDVRLGEATFTLELADFSPASVSGTVTSDKPLDLSVKLVSNDRIARIGELDEKPIALKTIQPDLGTDNKFAGKMCMVSLIVGKDGLPADLKVEKSTDDDLANKCVQAISQWQFKPGTIRGQPVRARVTVPFVVH